MKKYTTHYGQTFRASSHTAAHRHLCSMLSVDDGPWEITACLGDVYPLSPLPQGVEVHASLYDGRDFIRLADGRVRKDWPLSNGKVTD